jgi:hypothetical protein
VATVLTRLARAAHIVEQSPFWGGVATALAVKGGTRGSASGLARQRVLRRRRLHRKYCYQASGLPSSTVRCRRGPHHSVHIVVPVEPHRIGQCLCLQRDEGAAPVGDATRNRGDRSALIFDPQRETSGQRRVSRWCDRTGRGIHRVEGVATSDVPPSAVATDGGRFKPRTVSGARSPADESVCAHRRAYLQRLWNQSRRLANCRTVHCPQWWSTRSTSMTWRSCTPRLPGCVRSWGGRHRCGFRPPSRTRVAVRPEARWLPVRMWCSPVAEMAPCAT